MAEIERVVLVHPDLSYPVERAKRELPHWLRCGWTPRVDEPAADAETQPATPDASDADPSQDTTP